MKRILTLCLAAALSGCSAFRITTEMGMSEADFKAKNTNEKLVEMNQQRTVYSISDTSGNISYVYFEQGRLVAVDKGVRRPDVLIQTR